MNWEPSANIEEENVEESATEQVSLLQITQEPLTSKKDNE